MKGIILAGGAGTRLHPLTIAVSKQLMPISDKPMIYYSLSVLLMADIREILLISTPHDIHNFKLLLGDGSQIGCRIEYAVQEVPNGLAQAFVIGDKFIRNDKVALVLGDNIFYGTGLPKLLAESNDPDGGIVFAYHVHDPERYGVVDFDSNGKVLSIEEKPDHPKTNYAVPGLYIYDKNVVALTKTLAPSIRGELEITDLNKAYLDKEKLQVELLGRGVAWLDTGTHDSLLEASSFIATLQKRQGLMVACPEEIALSNNWIDKEQVKMLAEPLKKNDYGKYLISLC